MDHPFLILVKSNPLESHRPVEAIRIALGLSSGEHPVRIALLNKAPMLLGDDYEDLVDGELLSKYLPTFREWNQNFYVEEGAWKELDLGETDYIVEPVSMERIAGLIKHTAHIMVF